MIITANYEERFGVNVLHLAYAVVKTKDTQILKSFYALARKKDSQMLLSPIVTNGTVEQLKALSTLKNLDQSIIAEILEARENGVEPTNVGYMRSGESTINFDLKEVSPKGFEQAIFAQKDAPIVIACVKHLTLNLSKAEKVVNAFGSDYDKKHFDVAVKGNLPVKDDMQMYV